jgi:hypothetical protein
MRLLRKTGSWMTIATKRDGNSDVNSQPGLNSPDRGATMSPRNLRTARLRRARRPAALAAALSLLILSGPGLAQINPNPPGMGVSPPPPTVSGIPQAPVGHRQPRPSELPAETRREENTAPARPATDLLPSICVKC